MITVYDGEKEDKHHHKKDNDYDNDLLFDQDTALPIYWCMTIVHLVCFFGTRISMKRWNPTGVFVYNMISYLFFAFFISLGILMSPLMELSIFVMIFSFGFSLVSFIFGSIYYI